MNLEVKIFDIVKVTPSNDVKSTIKSIRSRRNVLGGLRVEPDQPGPWPKAVLGRPKGVLQGEQVILPGARQVPGRMCGQDLSSSSRKTTDIQLGEDN